tara:strand:+ start:2138 stop:2335 length:198 start_codon:yes stop_codon:yes gene_type:complete
MTKKNDEEMFEDYPQDFIDKIDDLKGKPKQVSHFENMRFSCDEIESPSGINSYGYQGVSYERKKR